MGFVFGSPIGAMGGKAMRLITLRTLICVGVILLSSGASLAERRVALVIGNSNYVHTAPLANPVNDARAIAAALQRLDFDVVLALDVTQNEMAQPLSEFAKRLQGADVALLFYAGHGLSFEGRNYLVPVDAKAESAIYVKFQMTPIDRIAEEMARSVRLNIVILDACRNNPLATELARSLGPASRSADVARGLSVMAPVGRESVILFATAPGDVAADGRGAHSPFTVALLNHIESPSASIEDVFREVRRDVREATRNQQLPEMWLRLEHRFQFRRANASAAQPPESRVIPGSTAATKPNGEDDRLYWESVRNLGDVGLLKSYVEEFPNGRYVTIAEAMIAKLSKAEPKEPSAAAPADARSEMSQQPRIAPSFNCEEDQGQTEQVICNDPTLARLDVELSQLYFRSFGRASRDDGLRLQKAQREWLKQRNACATDAPCIRKSYEQRIKELRPAAKAAGK
jgi:uncharacterized protein YecT (DUF1311 family)